jgi:hypothetical protein
MAKYRKKTAPPKPAFSIPRAEYKVYGKPKPNLPYMVMCDSPQEFLQRMYVAALQSENFDMDSNNIYFEYGDSKWIMSRNLFNKLHRELPDELKIDPDQ